MSNSAPSWSAADPYLAADAVDPIDEGAEFHTGTVLFTCAQMTILVAMSVLHFPGGVWGGIFSALPVLIASLFQPFVGLCTLFALMMYDDLFQLVQGMYTFSKMIAIFVAVGYLIRCQRRECTLMPIEPVTRWGLVFVSICMLSALWSKYPVLTLIGAISPTMLLLLGMMATQLVNTPARFRTILLCVALSVGVGGVMMALRVGPVGEYGRTQRVTLGEINLNVLCNMMAIGIIASLYLAWRLKNTLLRVALLGMIPFTLVGVLLTQSRAGLAALVLGLMAGGALGLRGEMGKKVVLLFMMLVVFAGLFVVVRLTGALGEGTFDRWKKLGKGADDRLYIIKVGLEVVKKNPLLGAGYRMFTSEYTEVAESQMRYGKGTSRDPHNSYLSALAELGPLGLILFVGMMIHFARAAFNIRPGPEAMFAIGAAAVIGLVSLKGTLWVNKYFYYTIALVVPLVRLYPRTMAAYFAWPSAWDAAPSVTPGAALGATAYRHPQ